MHSKKCRALTVMVPGETFCKGWAEGRRKKKGKRKYENRKSAVLPKQRESEHSRKEGAVSSAKNQRMHTDQNALKITLVN